VPGERRGGGPATEPNPFAVEDGDVRAAAPAGPVAGTLSVRRAGGDGHDRSSPARRRSRSSRRHGEAIATRAVVAGAAALGTLADVAPSGARWADRALAAAAVAVVAGAGAAARRWTWFVVAGGALALADGRVAAGCGAAALVLALTSTGPVRPAPAVGAAVGGLSGLALLGATDLGFHGSSMLAAGAVAAPLLVSGHRHAGRRTRRRARRVVPVLALLLVVVGGGYLLALARARPAVERGIELLEAGMEAARDGDDDLATRRLAAAADAFDEADEQLGAWYAAPARAVPVLGHNASAVEAMASAAAEVARDGTEVAVVADVDALTVQGGRLDLARVRALRDPLDDVADVLAGAESDLGEAAGPWLLPPVAERLDRVRDEVAAARPDVRLAADATEVVPAMFGGDGEARWLVAFVTPVEARGGTGLVGNFAELMAVDGEVDMTRFGRAAELEQGGTPGPQRTISEPRDYLERWARFEPAGTWRNVTMSPHFPSVGRVMADLYPQSGGRPVDGVIAVDPVGLAALLRFTGPIEVAGVPGPLTADDAAGFLLRDQYVVLDDTEQRIDALEALAETAFERLTTGDLPGPRRVADVLGPVVEGGHIQAYAVDEDQQRFFERLGLDGGLPPAEGDSLGVVVNNAVGNKVDLFLQRDVRYEVAWDPATGALEATATVTLTNDAPAAGLPDYVIGSALPPGERPPTGTNRTYLSVYSPWELEGARLDGEPVELERQREAGRYTYSLFVDVPPEGGTRTVELDLVGALPVGAGYELDVVAQPLVRPDRWSLVVEVAGDGEITAGDALAVEGRTVRSSGELTDRLTGYRIEVVR